MKDEVGCAANFVADLIRSGGPDARAEALDEEQVRRFVSELSNLLMRHYKHHWHPEKPTRGSGFRCLRTNHQADPILKEAARLAKLGTELRRLPAELTIWVDPLEVSYRIGEDGSVCNLLKRRPSSSISPNADSWYPASRSPPTPVYSRSPPTPMSPRKVSPSSSYHSNSSSPVQFEVRRSPPARRYSATDPWDMGSSLTYTTNHNVYRQQHYSAAMARSPAELRMRAGRSPSPPHHGSRMLGQVRC